MKTIAILLLLLVSVHLHGQDSHPDSIKIDKRPGFKAFLEKACNGGSDTSITPKDSLVKYRVIYSTNGRFIDPKNDLYRICDTESIQKEDFFVDVIELGDQADSLAHYFRLTSCQPIRTIMTNECWGEPLADSIINIYSDPSFWASCITAKEVRFPKEIPVTDLFETETKSIFQFPSIISYQNGKYLVIDIMAVIQIGNQTDSGMITTYYLERVE